MNGYVYIFIILIILQYKKQNTMIYIVIPNIPKIDVCIHRASQE